MIEVAQRYAQQTDSKLISIVKMGNTVVLTKFDSEQYVMLATRNNETDAADLIKALKGWRSVDAITGVAFLQKESVASNTLIENPNPNAIGVYVKYDDLRRVEDRFER